jgi:GGDEF domain-containing protein
MADEQRIHAHARARAVAELADEALAERAEELARRWAAALIQAGPLESIGQLPLEQFAREAPSLCAQVLRALRSDVELQRLTGDGASSAREHTASARALPAICGASEPAVLVEAVEALRGVLWEALLGQLGEPSARLLGDLGDRLAFTCSAMLAAAVAMPVPSTGARIEAGELEFESESSVPAEHRSERVPSPPGEVVIVDERWLADERASEPTSARAPAPAAEIEIRDERREEGPAAWISSIGAALEQFERDSVPFAVLLVELLELERLRREQPQELARLAGELEQALTGVLGSRSSSLTRERPGRCWLLIPASDRAGAEQLAQRLMGELHARPADGRAPLTVAIGTAVCPEDGREPAALAAHADIGLYAARSASA